MGGRGGAVRRKLRGTSCERERHREVTIGTARALHRSLTHLLFPRESQHTTHLHPIPALTTQLPPPESQHTTHLHPTCTHNPQPNYRTEPNRTARRSRRRPRTRRGRRTRRRAVPQRRVTTLIHCACSRTGSKTVATWTCSLQMAAHTHNRSTLPALPDTSLPDHASKHIEPRNLETSFRAVAASRTNSLSSCAWV